MSQLGSASRDVFANSHPIVELPTLTKLRHVNEIIFFIIYQVISVMNDSTTFAEAAITLSYTKRPD